MHVTVALRRTPNCIYQLQLSVKGTGSLPPVWRRLHVPGAITLDDLHRVFQNAMGWSDMALHGFEIAGQHYGPIDLLDDDRLRDERDFTLEKVVGTREPFTYTYDFTEGWEHEVFVERVLTPVSGVRYPKCVAGDRACPPEDCGGPAGHKAIHQALARPERHRKLVEEIGPFDPAEFSLDDANEALSRGTTLGEIAGLR